MAKRLSGIFASSNETDRTRALLELFASFKADDWQRALDASLEIGMGWGNRWFQLMLVAWAEAGPQAAIAWSEGKGDSPVFVMRAWIGKDPEAALAFVQSLGDDQIRLKELLRVAAIESLGGDLPRLGELLMEIPEEYRAGILRNARQPFTGVPLETLCGWAESFEAPWRGQVLSKILGGLQGAEAKLAFAQRYPQEIGPENYGAIYQEWVSADEAGAMASLEGLESETLRQAAAVGIAERLGIEGRLPDAIAVAKRYLKEIPDHFLSNLLISPDAKHARVVLAEIPRLKDDGVRLMNYHSTLDMWFKGDPDSARKWLAENEVPEQIRKQFEGK